MNDADGSLGDRLEAVRERIAAAEARAGRPPGSVTLVGASKGQPAERVVEAWRAGLRDFGENRVQEAAEKIPAVDAASGPGPQWHLIGHLQTNKARAAAQCFAILHGVDSVRLLDALAQSARAIRVFIQVNVAGEATKHGVSPEGLPEVLEHASQLPSITVEGLMTMAPLGDRPEDARPVFRGLRKLAETHGLAGLSMGMTNDFEVAIEEGATHVRIGRAIFGERQR